MLHITITGVHMDITEAIEEYTKDKLQGLSKYVSKDDTSAKLAVELSKTTNHHNHGNIFKAEGHFHTRGKEITVAATEEDLYASIDVLKDKLAEGIRSHKDKTHSVFKRSAYKVKNLFKRL